MVPRISIITPCYNQGEYLLEAVHSLAGIDPGLYELIIVNDGSTDVRTIEILKKLQSSGYKIIFQENKGLGGARNTAVRLAKGEFILPLDSDNKIRKEYLVKGAAIMDAHPNVGVVYGNAEYFGSKTGIWSPGPFNLQKLMLANYIDACALIRKSILDEVGGYDEKMEFMGWEDWDLWLRICFKGYDLYYLNEVLFDYRFLENSMGKDLYRKYERPNKLENYVNEKYPNKMGHRFINEFFISRFRQNPVSFIGKLILRTYFPAYYNRLLTKNKVRNWI